MADGYWLILANLAFSKQLFATAHTRRPDGRESSEPQRRRSRSCRWRSSWWWSSQCRSSWRWCSSWWWRRGAGPTIALLLAAGSWITSDAGRSRSSTPPEPARQFAAAAWSAASARSGGVHAAAGRSGRADRHHQPAATGGGGPADPAAARSGAAVVRRGAVRQFRPA